MKEQLRRMLPETKPAFQMLVVDDLGRMWLQLSALQGATEAEWIVVDMNGNTVATTSLPAATQLQATTGYRAIGVAEQEDSGAPLAIAFAIT